MEVWKDIEGYEGLYEVSNLGNVRSLNYKGLGYTHIIVPRLSRRGYNEVVLCKNHIKKYISVHRLVARAFISNPNNYTQVNHKNEIKTDNRVENLEWCTAQYNINYGTRNSRVKVILGKPVLQLSLTGELINEYISSYDASLHTKINRLSISRCARGVRNTAGGFKWQYKSGA